MPGLQPIPVNITAEEWKDAKPQLLRTLNYLIKDMYEWIGRIQGIETASEPIALGIHTHQAADQGGDYVWADLTVTQLAWLVAVAATVAAVNILDKTANEDISGTWKFTILTASTILGLNASKEIVSVTKQAHEADAAAVSAISLGAGADTVDRATFNTALGTLVTETNAIKTTLNSVLAKLEALNLLTSS